MSKLTNEELMVLHEAGKPVPKSDDARLGRLITAAYANERAERARLAWLQNVGETTQ